MTVVEHHWLIAILAAKAHRRCVKMSDLARRDFRPFAINADLYRLVHVPPLYRQQDERAAYPE